MGQARFLSLIILECGLLSSSTARAEQVAKLRYEARDSRSSCPDEARFRTLVTARLGRDPFVENSTDTISVRIAEHTQRLRGELRAQLGATKVERIIQGTAGQCDELAEALASVAALAIDPDAASGGPPNRAESPPEVSPAAPEPVHTTAVHDSPPTQVVPPPLRHGDALMPRFAVYASFAAAAGRLPAPSFGGEVGLGLALGNFSVLALGRIEAQGGSTEAGTPIEASLWQLGLAPCGHWKVVMGCLIGTVGGLNARSPTAATPSLGTSTAAFIGPRLGVSIPLGSSFSFLAHADGDFTIVRTTLYYGGNSIWLSPPVAVSFGIGFARGISP